MSIKKKEKKKWIKDITKNVNIKNVINDARERFSDFLELPAEVVAKTTKITIIENSSILIEGYKQIIDYYDNYIKIKAHNLDLVIDGSNLDIKQITDSDLVIEGNIYSLNYQK